VARKTTPSRPHQLSNTTPIMAITNPMIILIILSIGPTLHFIIIVLKYFSSFLPQLFTPVGIQDYSPVYLPVEHN
jgi:hypothetical protein